MTSVRVAVIDSGVHATHPHVNGVAGGVAILADSQESDDYIDRIGHGTAVTAVIREKAPEAEVFAVKVFDRRLTTDVETLVRAIEWCARNEMRLVNLSLGTQNMNHAAKLQEAIDQAAQAGALVISALEDDGIRWLPGGLPGVLPVMLDWTCNRDSYKTERLADGRMAYKASGYPRPAPGVPPERNLKGISFAVANVTGLIAREMIAGRYLDGPFAGLSS